jgi:hypothetical protein
MHPELGDRDEPFFHRCKCPPGEVAVIMHAEVNGVKHEFAGTGPTEAAAESDASRHVIEALGEDCTRYPARVSAQETERATPR